MRSMPSIRASSSTNANSPSTIARMSMTDILDPRPSRRREESLGAYTDFVKTAPRVLPAGGARPAAHEQLRWSRSRSPVDTNRDHPPTFPRAPPPTRAWDPGMRVSRADAREPLFVDNRTMSARQGRRHRDRCRASAGRCPGSRGEACRGIHRGAGQTARVPSMAGTALATHWRIPRDPGPARGRPRRRGRQRIYRTASRRQCRTCRTGPPAPSGPSTGPYNRSR